MDKEKKLCWWLRVASNVGQSMCYWILTSNGEYIARSTVIPIPIEDLNSSTLKEQMVKFTEKVHEEIGDHNKAVVKGETISEDDVYFDAFFDNKTNEDITWPWEKELEDLPLAHESEATIEELDVYLNTNVVLPGRDGVEVLAKVVSRKRDHNGKAIGTPNENPILDTRVYHIEFPDGHTEEYATNKIAEALLSQIDDEGFNFGFIKEICDHRKLEAAAPISEGFVGEGSKRKPVVTTKGWKIKILWKDGSYDWLPLSQVKESNPVEVAEYAVTQNIHKEPAFNWWVSHVIRKRERLINKVVSRTQKSNIKFGIIVLNTVEEAYQLDKENRNTYWRDSMKKEVDSVNKYGIF